MTAGAAESKPAISNMPASLGSAIVKLLEHIPHTINFASIPVASLYCLRASEGCMRPVCVCVWWWGGGGGGRGGVSRFKL